MAALSANNSFKPNLLRYTNNVAEKACHVVGSATQVGLTQALGLMKHDRLASIVFVLLMSGCTSLQDQTTTKTTIGELSRNPTKYDGKVVEIDACLVNGIHGVEVSRCRGDNLMDLAIQLSPPDKKNNSRARYLSMFPVIAERYSSTITGIFKVRREMPTTCCGTSAYIIFQSDSGTQRIEP